MTPASGCRRVNVEPNGPVLVEGPVEIVRDDGTIARSNRFMVAVCTCRRSRSYPWCDTSHRARVKTSDTDNAQNREARSTAAPDDTHDRNLP
ncbi:CDGSH iron-sulfur domain-containing protein [Streptomyces sp. NPDC006173]|uniref:CDGSH iron-sulfur domain-containing protein n=1 Tax=Streptomyces sp. NPDC006173 TaxID=3155349 RepID=UPI0033C01AB5